MEHFFSPKSGKDQKKGLHQKFFPRIHAQMHTRVKLLRGIQSYYWGGYIPHPLWVSAPLTLASR